MPLHLLDSALFANSQAFLKDYFHYILFFKCSFFFKIVHYYVDMSYFHKIAVFGDKTFVNDSTDVLYVSKRIL